MPSPLDDNLSVAVSKRKPTKAMVRLVSHAFILKATVTRECHIISFSAKQLLRSFLLLILFCLQVLSDFLIAFVSILCILAAIIIIGVLVVLLCWGYRLCRDKCRPREIDYEDQYEQLHGDNPPSYNSAHQNVVIGRRARTIVVEEEDQT